MLLRTYPPPPLSASRPITRLKSQQAPKGEAKRGGTFPPGDTIMIPFDWKLRLPPSHFGLLMPLNQQAKKGITVLTGVIDPDHQVEIGLPLHNRGAEGEAGSMQGARCGTPSRDSRIIPWAKGSHMQKNEIGPFSYTIHKDKLKMDEKTKCH
ncbi:unnamed protein product [Nyctereutes procyonoides]|uniref:(raccoon dog) hypothetical protein n=1 Tax=Nyctereutes procyonoides TaxID=34880 RepID=A0A811XZT5_NYCPR|nr:unnamed protein product [Nyctereutes procyonoides]